MNDRGEPPGERTVRGLALVLQDDEEELLALAGKVPEQLRDRAQQDVAFARVLRLLPDASAEAVEAIYQQLKSRPPEP